MIFSPDHIIVAVEPGHCQKASGAVTGAVDPDTGVREYDINTQYAVALELAFADVGIRTVRPPRTWITQTRIKAVAKEAKAFKKLNGYYPIIVWLSLHQNAVTDTSANGAEVFVSNPTSKSVPFARKILDTICGYGLRWRGVKFKPFWIFQTKAWAVAGVYDMGSIYGVLLEPGFITNRNDRLIVTDEATIKSIAEDIASIVYLTFVKGAVA